MEKTADIFCVEDVMVMLDSCFESPGAHWDNFYCENRARNIPIPFFADAPDENLAQYLDNGTLTSGKALELGCGPGRNAVFLAQNGYCVDAIDISQEAVAWAKERAAAAGLDIRFICDSIFGIDIEPMGYDLVYDSGCLHHLPPHRRISYVELLKKALKPNGYFALTCFVPDSMHEQGGETTPDYEIYARRCLRGGIGYTREKLQRMFANDFHAMELRRMQDMEPSSGLFGKSFLWAALFKKK